MIRRASRTFCWFATRPATGGGGGGRVVLAFAERLRRVNNGDLASTTVINLRFGRIGAVVDRILFWGPFNTEFRKKDSKDEIRKERKQEPEKPSRKNEERRSERKTERTNIEREK